MKVFLGDRSRNSLLWRPELSCLELINLASQWFINEAIVFTRSGQESGSLITTWIIPLSISIFVMVSVNMLCEFCRQRLLVVFFSICKNTIEGCEIVAEFEKIINTNNYYHLLNKFSW